MSDEHFALESSRASARASEQLSERGSEPGSPATELEQHDSKSDFADKLDMNPATQIGEMVAHAESQEVITSSVYDMIVERLTLSNLKPEMFDPDKHDVYINGFIEQQQMLVAYVDSVNGLTMHFKIPAGPIPELIFFIKRENVTTLTTETFFRDVYYGTIVGKYLESLYRMMSGIFVPIFFKNSTWPDSIKNDFTAQMHKFMASLTDTRWKVDGKTVLYIPLEATLTKSEVAAKNKEMVQRLETIMIHWTRQIKEVLSSQDALQTSENAGPLEEIDFWKNRCADLSGISDQLDKSGVKKVTTILEMAKSSYVTPFLRLSGQIKEGSMQAQSNLKFLSVLKEPCKELAEAQPVKIPEMLPNILSLIRMIWVNSEYYNTRERLTGILRKLSNEVINRCCKEINLEKVFAGNVDSSMVTLNECIICCEQWKEIYKKAARLHHKFSPVPWVLDQTGIFAQIDAFIQRCKDLLEVCECQKFFARGADGTKTDLPHFSGQRGPEILRGLLEIESVFEKNLYSLYSVKKTILDVKATSWHDDYNKFRNGMKDLEVMMQNLISSSFDTVTTVEQAVEVLDIFMHLTKREAIRRMIDKKTVDVYAMFNEELNAVKRELTQKLAPLPASHPKYSGQCMWAKMLKRGIERSMMALDRASFLPQIGSGEEIRTQYQQLCSALDEYMQKTFYEWTQSVCKEPFALLDVPLLRKNVERGLIDVNFDEGLLKLFQEIHYWERLLYEVPHYVTDIFSKREDYRIQRENVLLVVRDYNRILASLSPEEKGLFRERIRFLDKKILPGLTKIFWSMRSTVELFVQECRTNASRVQGQVDSYKGANMDIGEDCKNLSELLLVRIDPKKIYEDLNFAVDQANHREITLQKLFEMHTDLVTTMNRTFDVFKNDGNEVQQHWHSYTVKMDNMVEEALRLNVKWSLQELSRAINGDGKSGPNPLLKVKVILSKDKDKERVDFSPSQEELATMVNNIAVLLANCLQDFQRLPDILTKKKSTKEPIYEIIARDLDIEKIKRQIATGMQNNSTSLTSYLTTWDNYREIWEINKDAFIQRYRDLNPSVASFDADIARYTEVMNNVQTQETILNIQFVLLDCSSLKFSILAHCQEWQNKFTNLLFEIASTNLNDVTVHLNVSKEKVALVPQNLDELGEALIYWEQLNNEKGDIEAKFPPLYEQFQVLEKYEVSVPEDLQKTLTNLTNEWLNLQQAIVDSDIMLKKVKEKFKTNLLSQSEDFKKQVMALVEEFHSKGPFGSHVASSAALAMLTTVKEQMNLLKDQEVVLRKGLLIFKIDQSPSKEIAKTEQTQSTEDIQRSGGGRSKNAPPFEQRVSSAKIQLGIELTKFIQDLEEQLELVPTKQLFYEVEQLELVWQLTSQWETYWESWKSSRFLDIRTKELEEISSTLFKKLYKLARELKAMNWEIVEVSKNKVDQFRRTMPLISDLNNPALRPRHWQQIQTEIGRTFDPKSDEFTLEKIMEWDFSQYADKINDISQAASKELAIETGLAEINATWESIEFDMVVYKDKGHYKLRSAEEIFNGLDDNQVKLVTMKASRFVKAFETDVDRWERTLSTILETVEMLLIVQRLWMYLENIFMGEDIRRQLPKESLLFDEINNIWKVIMNRLFKIKNVYRGTHSEGLLDILNGTNTKLEDIMRSLDMYLETKRQIFPRFYFISNDDLLEILGQSKNPLEIQHHFRKCFDNIKTLNMAKQGMAQKWEGSHMNSMDGESIAFFSPITLEGAVEGWLCDVEKTMRMTLKEELKKCKLNLRKMLTKRDKWIKDHPGQMCITASQIQWTADVTKALTQTKERGDKKILKSLKKKQVAMLNKFSEAIRSNLTKIQRLKIVALVTIEIHARDILERLAKGNCSDPGSFEWLKELRVYWDRDTDDCIVKQTNTQFQYAYEYLGNSGRLVITPLTDRCYITLTTALHLHKGGSPKGPAGTGKTETVKDLGKSLGAYVIVVNCSEGLDYKSMGRMFSGLSQTGAWGCFDEFNRINIEVLSVVAQQILSIMSALSANATRFIFEGREIRLEWSCGIFITMNPGYAGRTELPDNLKSMFRPISMMVPDSTLIAEIILFGEGFNNTKVLAKKVFTLYSLAVQQLSKQDHYDFGLRALVSVLRYAGRKKRTNPNMHDEEILLLSMKDMNIAKLSTVDLPLFSGIVSDLFPGIEMPVIDYSKFKNALEHTIKGLKYQSVKHLETKVLQLFETKNSRHSTMIVGKTLSGKSASWRVLQATLGKLCRENEPGFNFVREYPINPKAVSLAELYGEFNLATNEWTDGVLSNIMRTVCADERPDEKWIIFDGPVDAVWIESMNSVMDDNKILTLINGERISMPEQVSLLFEVGDLAVASPATVSRCGMVYYDYIDLGWRPYVESWLETKEDKTVIEELRRLFDKFIGRIQQFKIANACKELIPVEELNGIISLCRLFDALATVENGMDPADQESLPRIVEFWFLFSMIWSLCASVDEDGRKKLDAYIREIDGSFPNKDTIYEYFVEPKSKTWVHWEDKLKQGWKLNPNLPFYKLIVPTVDTVRYVYLANSLTAVQHPVMLVGPVGTGKTSVAQGVLQKLDPKYFSFLTVNISAQTTSNNIQDIIESRVEKRTKAVYVPVGGKKMLTFMDDFNMPIKDTYGSQPPLELINLWLNYGFWYDRAKQTIKYVKDMFLMVAMGPPGGGRTVIPSRLQSKFNLINMTFPQESQIKRIFGSMISQKLQEFEEELKPIGEVMTQATIEMYRAVVQRFLPTPTKIHYLFNLRDISRVFQGLLRVTKTYHDSKTVMCRLWIHECFRVFSDRLADEKDREAFVNILTDKLGSLFDQTYHNICKDKVPPVFGDYLSSDGNYEDLQDMAVLRKGMRTLLAEYNNSPNVIQMDLVLFRDAIEHVSKIVRVIRQPRGNMLLVGIGGSGRQSLTRLASFVCLYNTFQVEVGKNYKKENFREDIRRLYFSAGVDNKETVFLFMDTQAVEESFMEDLNNMLSSGEVSNMYKPDEFEEVKNALAEDARKEGIEDTSQAMFAFLIERVRANLHIVLCMSPVGEPFRNRIRMYPAFVNCTTIDWFSEWPYEALLEVADKYLDSMEMADENETKLKPSLAKMFAMMHSSVSVYAKKILDELRRHIYVTPTNYLELVDGYKKLLYEKRTELMNGANKLKNGLFKIDETRVKVEAMSMELVEAKKKVEQFQRQCEDYLIIIVQQKREADEQAKAVSQKSEKIAEEEVKCQRMADLAMADLAEAMPALEEAVKALESLNKKDITEIKSYGKPPALVEKVLEAVMILRGNEPTWAEAKRQLGDQNFIKQLINFDKDNISDRVLKKITSYCIQSDFQPEIVGRVSNAAKSLCMWVRAMEVYGRIYRVVEPKRQRLNAAESQLREKQAMLQDAKNKLAEVEAKMAELKQQYDEKLQMKEDLRKKAEHMEMMLDRASQLVDGLSGERERWLETVKDLEERTGLLIGDVLIASAFLSYMGPFLSNYRDEIVTKIWTAEVIKLEIPCTRDLNLCGFLVDPTKVRDWNIQGLPGDSFSTENGVIVTRGRRWPLMIDPQCQALKWIKNMEGPNNLKVIDMQMHDYMRVLENAIQQGLPVLLQNIGDKLEASLDPILNKSVKRVGGVPLIKLGDKDVEYNEDFRFYITTKLSNPHYPPEVATKTTIVNFAVKLQGLQGQLLGVVIRKERPELEEQKDHLVRSIASGKKKIKQLEDDILRMLNEAKGSLLDDEQLLTTLQASKATSQEVSESLVISEATEIQIDEAREGYHPSAQRAAILFFVLNDMGAIDPMYQFALDSYVDLFNLSIDKSQRSSKLDERIANLNEYHTFAVYRFACRGLFERHKLLFSFHMCAKILEAAGKINMEEYNFFLRGGIVLDRDTQMDNPCGWLLDVDWDNITELEKLTNFHGIITSFEQYQRDWNAWYTTAEPESATLPGEWDNTCNELQRMLIVRSLRQDRVSFCVTSFIINNLGSKFIEPPILSLKSVVEDSIAKSPLIFVLSPGVDPTNDLLTVAESKGMMPNRFHALSLGQGQATFATRMIKEGIREGNWVFLANCHLSLSWMPALDKLVENMQSEEPGPHPDFRLWLSSSPNPNFPISILQSGIKMTTEPPKGLKSNMKRMYTRMSEQQFGRCHRAEKYKKLLFSLIYFHSVLIERRKFLMLGWNIKYDFNDSDFEVSENILSIYLDDYEETPWDALKFLIAGISYGGHVTDDWDRRLLNTYIADYFCEDAIGTQFFKVSPLPTYYIPKDGPLGSYREYVSMLPNMDHPEAFGQHPNADITSQIQEARALFETLLSMQPQIAAGAGESREEKVIELADNIKKQLPDVIDYDNTQKIMASDTSPLKTVLLQEIERYNSLLCEISQQLIDLEKGIRGLVVMSADLEEIFACIYDGRVPSSWLKAYPSMKPLASWTRDLVTRVEQFQNWAVTARAPKIFWLSGFTFPTGFLTAVLQLSARLNNISIDLLSWDFSVMTVDDTNIAQAPKDGVLIRGLYLQGAGWDMKNSCLIEAEPMQLVCPMPTIHFKPVEAKRRSQRGIYSSPCYYYPNRAGTTGRASFIVPVDLKCGDKTAEHWTKRGTALLMSLDI